MNTAATRVPSADLMHEPTAANPPSVHDQNPMISIIERAARDPSIDVEKLERLIALQEKAQLRQAEQSFNAAMSLAQSEMGAIAVDSNNPQTKSKYASYFALDKALRPIYSKNGFALSFGTGEISIEQYVRVICYASHRDGFTRTYHVDMPADGKGAKGGDVMTKTHAVGSAMTYGQRYLLKMIFNIAIGSDDDGNSASPRQNSRVPSPSEAQRTEPAKTTAAPKHQKPRQIVPEEKDTFDKWTSRYLAGIETSTSVEELMEWDNLNDQPLGVISNKSKPHYTQIMNRLEELRAKLQRESISTGTAPAADKVPTPSKAAEVPNHPNAELEPEKFVLWAEKRMNEIDNADDLSNVWETEIMPAADGLFKPDCDSLSAYYEKRLAKLG